MNKSYVLMLFAATCWAGAFVAGKIGSASVSGVEMSFYRFVIASICLIFYIRIKGLSLRIGLKNVLIIAAVGSLGMLGYHLLFFKSIKLISVIESSSINTLAPVLSAVFGWLFFREHLNFKGVCFLLLTSSGVLSIITGWNPALLAAAGKSAGTLYMAGAMLAWVAYSLLLRRFVRGIPAAVSSFISIAASALILLPAVVAGGVSPLSYGSNVWAVYLFMGIFSTFIGYTIQQDSIMKIGVARTNFFINFVPVFSMLLGVLILGDAFRPMYLISLAMIFGGLAGFMRQKARLIAAAGAGAKPV